MLKNKKLAVKWKFIKKLEIIYKEQDDLYYSYQQIADIQNFLISCIGDMELNNQLLLTESDNNDINVINDLVIFTYRTRFYSKIQDKMDQLWTKFQAVKDKKILFEHEKITFDDYGRLNDLACLNKVLHRLYQYDLIVNNAVLNKLYTHTKKAFHIVRYYDQEFNNYIIPTGTLLFENVHLKNIILGKLVNLLNQLLDLIKKIGHVSCSFYTSHNRISHFYPNYKEEALNLKNFLYNQAYQIDLVKLINKNVKVHIEKNYGTEWYQKIESMYQNIILSLHHRAEKRYKNLQLNNQTHMLFLFNYLTSFYHENLIFSDHNNKDIRDKIFGRKNWEKNPQGIICSEFIAMTFIAALQELNDKIMNDIKSACPKDLDQILEIPIDEKEKLSIITPKRLFNILQKKNILKPVQAPKKIHEFLSSPEQKIHKLGFFPAKFESKFKTCACPILIRQKV